MSGAEACAPPPAATQSSWNRLLDRLSRRTASGEPAVVAEADGDADPVEVLQQGDGGLAGGAERLLGLGGGELAAVGEGVPQGRDRRVQDVPAEVEAGGQRDQPAQAGQPP